MTAQVCPLRNGDTNDKPVSPAQSCFWGWSVASREALLGHPGPLLDCPPTHPNKLSQKTFPPKPKFFSFSLGTTDQGGFHLCPLFHNQSEF